MPSLVWCLLLVSILSACWMIFDGLHALILGDYVTPRSGPDAGRLGPWSRIVSAIGIEPRCTAMKLAFVLEGTITLAFLLAFVLGAGWAWWGRMRMISAKAASPCLTRRAPATSTAGVASTTTWMTT